MREEKGRHLIMQLALKVALAALLVAGTRTALAYIPPETQSMDLKTVNVVKPPVNPFVTKSMVIQYLPTNLTPGTNRTLVWTQFQSGVQQKVSDAILNSSMVKQNSVANSVAKINDNLQKVAQKSVSISGPGGVPQKFSMNVNPAMRQATVNYQGYFDSNITYFSQQNNMVWTVSRPVDKTTTVKFTNTMPMGQAPSSLLSISRTF